jgi:excisionase family DNA binding protein
MAELVNLREASTELKVSIHTLRAWAYQKRIPVVRLGRRVLLRRQDVEELVNKNLIKAHDD